jgi:hypothetical protein
MKDDHVPTQNRLVPEHQCAVLSFCSKNRVPFCQLSETDSLSTPIIGDLLPIQPFRT